MKKITFILLLTFIFLLVGCMRHPSRWREIKLENEFPEGRSNSQMVYIGNNKTILFGGNPNGEITFSDVWEYNIEKNVWTEIERNEPYPPGRLGFQMAFDGVDKVVIYAGVTRDRNTMINDVWEYDINTHIWTEHCTEPDDIKPSYERRYWSDMCYGGEQGKVIMFGGNAEGAAPTCQRNDLWEYDTITHTWSEIIVDGSKPSPRFDHRITYVNNKIILFGGWVWGENMHMDDTWEFDLTKKTWQKINTLNNHPPGRHMNCLAKLNDNKALLFCGETKALDCSNDTWEYNTETKQWTEYTSENMPSERVKSAICYGGNDNVIMFAGLDPLGPGESLYYGDLWEYSHENEEE